MSVEQTFRDIHIPDELYSKCEELCVSLADSLKEESLVVSVIKSLLLCLIVL